MGTGDGEGEAEVGEGLGLGLAAKGEGVVAGEGDRGVGLVAKGVVRITGDSATGVFWLQPAKTAVELAASTKLRAILWILLGLSVFFCPNLVMHWLYFTDISLKFCKYRWVRANQLSINMDIIETWVAMAIRTKAILSPQKIYSVLSQEYGKNTRTDY